MTTITGRTRVWAVCSSLSPVLHVRDVIGYKPTRGEARAMAAELNGVIQESVANLVRARDGMIPSAGRLKHPLIVVPVVEEKLIDALHSTAMGRRLPRW